MTDPIRVALIEDDARTSRLVARTIEEQADLALAGAFDSGEAAIAAVRPGEVDVVVVDLELGGIDGVETSRRLGELDPPPERLILTAFASDDKVFGAIRAGAAGYLLKRDVPERLPPAVREVFAGGTVIEPRLARRFWNLFDAARGSCANDAVALTAEELDVLMLVARGLTNREASGVLGRTPRQVKLQLERIFVKMGVRTRVDAVTAALRAGLIRL
ncbi:MAG: response regulator transcription factor [Deltaproteobacteria bacterium]|nr:response regulator transcription factor [Deltaproteobacteria bacterium]